MSNTKAWLSYCADEDELLEAISNLKAGYTLQGDKQADEVHRRATWKTLALHARPITDKVFHAFVGHKWLYDQLMLNSALGREQSRELLDRTLQSLRNIEESSTRDVLSELVSSAPAEFSFTTLTQALEAYHRRFVYFPSSARQQIVTWIGKFNGSRDWTIENIRAHLLDVMIGIDMQRISTEELIELYRSRADGSDIHIARLMNYQAATPQFFEHVLDAFELPGGAVAQIAGRDGVWSSRELRRQLTQQILDTPTPEGCRALLAHTNSAPGFRKRFQALSSEHPQKALEVLEDHIDSERNFLEASDLTTLLARAPEDLRPSVLRAAAHLSTHT